MSKFEKTVAQIFEKLITYDYI